MGLTVHPQLLLGCGFLSELLLSSSVPSFLFPNLLVALPIAVSPRVAGTAAIFHGTGLGWGQVTGLGVSQVFSEDLCRWERSGAVSGHLSPWALSSSCYRLFMSKAWQ